MSRQQLNWPEICNIVRKLLDIISSTEHVATMLQKLSIMFLSNAPKVTYYVFWENTHYFQNYATNFSQ